MDNRISENEADGLARPVSAVIVEGHDITRAGLRSLLEQAPNVRVMGEAADAQGALQLCSRHKPRLILVDASLALGVENIITALREVSPGSVIVALGAEQYPEAVLAAIQAGASAFLLRDTSASVLTAALERVLAGEAFVDPTLAGQIVRAFTRDLRSVRAVPAPDPLTPRELEVLRSVARGRSNKEIAFDLKLATGTVKVYIERILRKLSVANRAEATMHAVRLGLLDPEDGQPAGRSPSTPGRNEAGRNIHPTQH